MKAINYQFISPISWVGGKAKNIKHILKYIPQQLDNYYEPFCGGFSIGLRLLMDKRIQGSCSANDINRNLINFWKGVKYNEIIGKYPIIISEEEAKLIYDKIWPKKDKKAWEFLLINRLSFSGIERAKFSPTRWNKKYYNCLERVKNCENLLKMNVYDQVYFYNLDYKDFIRIKEDSNIFWKNQNWFYFIDPPYHCASKGLYEYENINYKELLETVKLIKGNFLLTICNCEEMRELFKEFYQYQENWKYSLRNGGKQLNKTGKELIITNYDPKIGVQERLNYE